MKEESLKRGKSLYLCFEEFIHRFDTAHVIQTIKLSELPASPTDGDQGGELKLGEVAYRCEPESDVPTTMRISLIGSKILFSGGVFVHRKGYRASFTLSKEVCDFETDPSIDANPKLQPSQVYKTSRPAPFLEEVAGQVYCLGGPTYSDSFEVFDKTQMKWLPLDVPVPPEKYPSHAPVCHATVGNKLLVWVTNKTGVLGFDVTQPEKGWTELDSSLGCCIPFVANGNDPLFVKLKSDRGDGDHGILMFSCDLNQPLTVRVFHVSHECDSMKPMEPLQLPKLPRTFPVPQQCKFFHLEDTKVGLVLCYDRLELSYYIYNDDDGDDDDDDVNDDDDDDDDDDVNMKEESEEEWRAWDWTRELERIHVMVFEYEIAVKSMDIKYKLLTTRCLE